MKLDDPRRRPIDRPPDPIAIFTGCMAMVAVILLGVALLAGMGHAHPELVLGVALVMAAAGVHASGVLPRRRRR